MSSPYVVPEMLQNTPLGIDWDSIPQADSTEQDNEGALLDICWIASDAVDSFCFQPLRATADIETVNGPDYWMTISQATGVAHCIMNHWPIIAVLGGQYSPAANFPPTWQPLTANNLRITNPANQIFGGSQVGSSGSDGSNGIDIQPGLVTAWYGRDGYVVQLAYINGWPTAGLVVNAAKGDTVLHVDDVTGMAGLYLTIFDGGDTERVQVLTAVADTPITVLPGIIAQVGPGTITIASGLRYAHLGQYPATVLASSMPSNVRLAAYYYAAAEALTRGATAITAAPLPGSITGVGASGSPHYMRVEAEAQLKPYRRVI